METNCNKCGGTGWICESCRAQWESNDGTTCCDAGVSCECNPDADADWIVIHASVSGEKFDKRH